MSDLMQSGGAISQDSSSDSYGLFADSPIQFFFSRYAVAMVVMVGGCAYPGYRHESHPACVHSIWASCTHIIIGEGAVTAPCDRYALLLSLGFGESHGPRYVYRLCPKLVGLHPPPDPHLCATS